MTNALRAQAFVCLCMRAVRACTSVRARVHARACGACGGQVLVPAR
jgi:hypothetical protein